MTCISSCEISSEATCTPQRISLGGKHVPVVQKITTVYLGLPVFSFKIYAKER
jgi:hypothetical protein